MAHDDVPHWQRYPIENQPTQPLPSGNILFRAYLAAHHLNSLAAARLSGVLYITTWNIEQDKPVSLKNAVLVRAGLRRVTGVAYKGPIAVHG